MTGIGGQEEQGKIITAQTLLPDTVDGVLDALREIILKGNVVGISVKQGEPIIYERYVPAGQEVSPDESTHALTSLKPIDVLRNVSMDEFDETHYGMEGFEGPTVVMWMFLILENQGYSVTHLVLSESSSFWPWLGISTHAQAQMRKFLGANVVFEKELPDDVFLLCGSPHRGATIAEVKFALKGNVPGDRDEGTDEEGR